MNESDYLRQQLRAERVHLREVLELQQRHPAPAHAPYLAWGIRRQQDIHQRHLALLTAKAARVPATPTAAAAAAAAEAATPGAATAADLPALLAAVDDLETLAAPVYSIPDWRQAAQLTADTVLEERRLYTAALQAGPAGTVP